MSPIDPLGPLLAQIRARAARLERGTGRRGAAEPQHPEADAASESLLQTVVRGVAALSPELPDRRRRAFRLFLEVVLTRELGVQRPDAPQHQELVENVLASMERDRRLKEAIERAADALLELAR